MICSRSPLPAVHSPVTPIILAGGSGTRLWPLSRPEKPKQFLKLYGSYTMLQHTVQRVAHLASPVVVCGEAHRAIAGHQLASVCPHQSRVILEPSSRNTAPAITAATLAVQSEIGEDAVLVVLPADHQIKDEAAFHAALSKAIAKAKEGRLVTFGIVPDRPETNFGYIKAATPITELGAPVAKFVEKPGRAQAEQYLATGRYYWNSGMLAFQAKTFLAELLRLQPKIHQACLEAWKQGSQTANGFLLWEGAYNQAPATSVDYAVMEHTQNAWMIPLNCGWNDLGTWQTLHQSRTQQD